MQHHPPHFDSAETLAALQRGEVKPFKRPGDGAERAA